MERATVVAPCNRCLRRLGVGRGSLRRHRYVGGQRHVERIDALQVGARQFHGRQGAFAHGLGDGGDGLEVERFVGHGAWEADTQWESMGPPLFLYV